MHPRSQQAFCYGSLSLRLKFLTGKHSRFAVLSITHSLSLESDGLFGSLMVLGSEQVAICEGSLVIRSILSKTDTPCQPYQSVKTLSNNYPTQPNGPEALCICHNSKMCSFEMLKILITNKSDGLRLKQLTDLKKHIACWAKCLFLLTEICSRNTVTQSS